MRAILLILLCCIVSAVADVIVTGPQVLSGPVLVNLNGMYIAPPVAAFTLSTNEGPPTLSIDFSDTTANTPIAWDWNFGDGSSHSALQNPSHDFTAPGIYTIGLTASNGGGSSYASHTVTVFYQPDIYMDWETGSEGDFMTTTMCTNSTHGTFGEWSTTYGGSPQIYITNIDQALRIPVVVSGTTYKDLSGTRSIAVDFSYRTNNMRCNFTASTSSATAGFWITPGGQGTTSLTLDYVMLNDSAGHFAVAQSGGSFGLHAHCVYGGVSITGPDIHWVAGTRYWLTLQWATGSPGTVTVSLYDTSGTLLGTSSASADGGPITYFEIGRIDNHNVASPQPEVFVDYDDVSISTSGAFPLGP